MRADWDPQPADDDGDEPQPKGADSLTGRIDVLLQVRERVDDGEDEGDDDPCYGSRCSDSPGVCLFESINKTFPPVLVLGEDYEGCEESVTGGYMEWNLLEVDESPGSVGAIRVVDGRKTIAGPASVEGCESERKCCESWRSDSEDNWYMMVRKR